MPHSKLHAEKQSLIFIATFYLFGLILHIVPVTRSLVTGLTEIFLLLINSLVLSFAIRNNMKNLINLLFWFLFTYLSIYITEVIAVNTGELFGAFWFGQNLPTQLAGVPLVIALNWIILVFSGYSLASKISAHVYQRIILSSFFIVVLDFLIEPVAMKLDYWQWENHIVPFQNYAVWFVISLVFSSLIAFMKIESKSIVLRNYFLIQVVYFGVLSIFL
jgi:bisanhydrobacterioruberin hydratase